MRAFVDKGRYTDLLAGIPVQVVFNDQAALRGAAYYAAFLAGDWREIIICRDIDGLSRKAAEQFVALARQAIAAHGRFCVALSGGSTPKAVYSLLATANPQAARWRHIRILSG